MDTNKKVLLLDIDYTLLHGNEPRPFLKQFMLHVRNKYRIAFYTGGTPERVTDILRVLHYKLGLRDDEDDSIKWWMRDMQRDSLHRDNCPIVQHKTKEGAYIDIKSFDKAAERLKCDPDDIILIDDNYDSRHPRAKQIICAPMWHKDVKSDYFLMSLIEEGKI